jgi:hypothetical protein
MFATSTTPGGVLHHFIVTVHVRMSDDQADRYRQLRDIPPGGEVRPVLVAHLQEELEGLGALDDTWTVELGRDR